MPRGIYERKSGKTGTPRKQTTAQEPSKSQKTAKVKTAGRPAGRPRLSAAPRHGANEESFDTLRANISMLTNARALLTASDQEGSQVIEDIDTELVAELSTLRDLRRSTFGATEDEKESDEKESQSFAGALPPVNTTPRPSPAIS